MENSINGKVVVITGSSSGMGEATALLLASLGAKVVLGARRLERLKELADRIVRAGGEVAFIGTNVKQRQDVLNLVKLAIDKFGRLDVMINNAGIAHLSRMDELQVEDWEEMIDVNLKGFLYGIAAAIPVFKEQGSGHIINIISTSGIRIVPLQGVYAGTKNAVRTIAEAMRQESGGRWRITGISPGFVYTEFVDHLKNETMKAAAKEKMREIGIAAEDIARAVVYAIAQPANVEVGDIVIRPAVQD